MKCEGVNTATLGQCANSRRVSSGKRLGIATNDIKNDTPTSNIKLTMHCRFLSFLFFFFFF